MVLILSRREIPDFFGPYSHTGVWNLKEAAMVSINGFAFVVMTSASALACGIAYWAGRITR
jgi:hypothetical protein